MGIVREPRPALTLGSRMRRLSGQDKGGLNADFLGRASGLARHAMAIVVALVVSGCSTSETITTVVAPATEMGPKYAAYVVDASSGRVLYDYAGGAPRYPPPRSPR